jgi:hypothetical protein
MEPTDEIAQLKKEVALLKEQMADLHRFFTIEDSEGAPHIKTLLITCSTLLLRDPEPPNETQALFSARDKGVEIALWGDDQKARLILEAKKEGRITLYQTGLKTGVDIGVDEKNFPYIGVLDQGKPRAIMKARPEGGVVSMVHDDGKVRAMMTSESLIGELLVVNADMKVAVKLSSNGQDGGGFLTVNHPNGKAAAIISSHPATGMVILNDKRGTMTAALPIPGQTEDEKGEA